MFCAKPATNRGVAVRGKSLASLSPDEIADVVYGEEIILSHDVLEASTGTSSAEILTLPNRTVLRYLRKHYAQQCSKLDDRVFQRASWERVAPEV